MRLQQKLGGDGEVVAASDDGEVHARLEALELERRVGDERERRLQRRPPARTSVCAMRISIMEKLRSSSTGGSDPSAPKSTSTMVKMKSRSKPMMTWLSHLGTWKMPATAFAS